MTTLIGLFTLGRDMEARATAGGDRVGNLALVYEYGKKVDGKRASQWIDAVLWGDRVDQLQQWLVKGAQFELHIDEVHIETFTRRDQTEGFKLVGRVTTINFTRGGVPEQDRPERVQSRSAAPSQQRRAPAPAPKPQGGGASGFDDFEDPPF